MSSNLSCGTEGSTFYVTEGSDSNYAVFIEQLRKIFELGGDNITQRQWHAFIKCYGFYWILPKTLWNFFCREDFFARYRQLSDGSYNQTDWAMILLAAHQSYYHFSFTKYIISFLSEEKCNIDYKLLHNIRDGYQRDITLPHEDIDHSYIQCIKASYSPLPQNITEQYKKSKDLFVKIASLQNDEEKWIQALQETHDDLFVQQNIEFRIGENMDNKMLWEFYISYLKKSNPLAMLHTFSKYCRFRTEDTEMKRRYEEETKIHGRISVSWKNPFHFEIYDPEAISKFHHTIWNSNIQEATFEKIKNGIECKNESIKMYFSTLNMIPQRQLSFKKSFMDYILSKADLCIWQKLYFCCKEFYSKQQFPICYKLILDSPPMTLKYGSLFSEAQKEYKITDFIDQSLKIRVDNNPAAVFPAKRLAVSTYLSVVNSRCSDLLSSFIPKIHICEAKYIEISFQNLTFDEFKFLAKNAVELNMREVSIINSDNGERVTIENLLSAVLNIQFFEISEPIITPNTAEMLSKIKFKNKIQRFMLYFVRDLPEFDAFSAFIKENFSSNCKFGIHFVCQYERNFIDTGLHRFKEIVGKTLREILCPKYVAMEKWCDVDLPNFDNGYEMWPCYIKPIVPGNRFL
uniref:Uncharacterized protein n=1 Tax=Panagrolaimus davidi TaxID=227884 RepID=A0A914PHP5_9BILA